VPYFNSGGNKLYYRDIGSGPPVILISGLAANHRGWGLQFLDLKKSFRLIALDNRGFGKSKGVFENIAIEDLALDIGNLMEVVGLEKANIIGSSMGGLVALEFALKNQKKVSSLVLTSTPIHKSLTPCFEEFFKSLKPTLLAENQKELFLQTLSSYVFSSSFLSDERYKLIAEFSGRSSIEYHPKVIFPQLRAIDKWLKLKKWKEKCEVPCLFVFGTDDKLISYEGNSNFFYEYFAKSEVKIIEDAGHAVHIEKPKEFNKVIREFLKSLE